MPSIQCCAIKLLQQAVDISALGQAPEGVELVRRRTAEFDYIFALNHTNKKQTLDTPEDWLAVMGSADMDPYGIVVYKIQR